MSDDVDLVIAEAVQVVGVHDGCLEENVVPAGEPAAGWAGSEVVEHAGGAAQSTGTDEVNCPVCGQAVSEDFVRCERCDTPHHRDCWEYTGGCAIFGCLPPDVVKRRSSAASRQRTGTEDIDRAVRRWLFVYSLEGYAKLAASMILLVLFSVAPIAVFLAQVGSEAFVDTVVDLVLVPAGMFSMGMVYVLLGLFALLHPVEWWLSRPVAELAEGSSPSLGAVPGRRVLDRLDPLVCDAWAVRWLDRIRLAIFAAGAASLLEVVLCLFGLSAWGFSLGAFSVLLIVFVLYPTVRNEFKERVAVVTSIQNRLAASLKKDS